MLTPRNIDREHDAAIRLLPGKTGSSLVKRE